MVEPANVVAGLPRQFWVLWSATLANRLGFFVIPFLALFLVDSRGFSTTHAGVVLLGWGIGSVVGQPVGGLLADTLGRRSTIVASMLGTSCSYLALAFVADEALLVGVALVAGIFTDMYRPAVAAAVSDLTHPAQRARAFALLYWAINLGVGVSSVVGGLLAARSYQLLFVLDAATCTVVAVVVLVGVSETRPATFDGRPARPSGYRTVVRDRRLRLLTLATFAFAAALMQGYATVPVSMARDGLGPAAYGLAISANAVTVIVLQPLLLRPFTRMKPEHLYALGAAALGGGLGLTMFADSTIEYTATIVVWTVGEIALNTAAPVILANLAPEADRAKYQAFWGTSFSMALIVGPAGGLLVLAHLGEAALWSTCMFVSALSGAVALAVGRSPQQT